MRVERGGFVIRNRIPGYSRIKSLLIALIVIMGVVLIFCTSLSCALIRKGLNTLEARMGADIMVVNYQTTTRMYYDTGVLQGILSPYYFNSDTAEQIRLTDGIRKSTTQLYMASIESYLCPEGLNLVAYDPETDFAVSAWICSEEAKEDGYGIIAGHNVDAEPGEMISFLGLDAMVTGKLDETGTFYDETLFIDFDTCRQAMKTSLEEGILDFGSFDPDSYSSCMLIYTDADAIVEEVQNDINLYVRGVKAIRADSAMSKTSDSFTGASAIALGTAIFLWIMVPVVLIVAFFAGETEREKEFALLRVIGISHSMALRIAVQQCELATGVGMLTGFILSLLLSAPVSALLQRKINLPFISMGRSGILCIAILASLYVAFSSIAASAIAAVHILRKSPIDALREDDA